MFRFLGISIYRPKHLAHFIILLTDHDPNISLPTKHLALEFVANNRMSFGIRAVGLSSLVTRRSGLEEGLAVILIADGRP